MTEEVYAERESVAESVFCERQIFGQLFERASHEDVTENARRVCGRNEQHYLLHRFREDTDGHIRAHEEAYHRTHDPCYRSVGVDRR